jgi:GTP1/Obg family GTP-binding protein
MTDEVKRRMATANRKAVRDRNYRRARDRALARLAHLYPDTYKQLLEMEKKQDELQGKRWISIDGSTVLSVGVHTRATGANDLAYPNNAGQDEGNNGGET